MLENRFLPHKPAVLPDGRSPQTEFLLLMCREAMYGGAAGGGKSDALLMASLMFVDTPGYNAILFRRTYVDLALEGALMDRSKEWLMGSGAHWSEINKRWTFPSGATLTFAYMQALKDRFRYQSAEFQFIGFDEVTQFYELQYTYMFSRLRRLEKYSYIPLRVRCATNPGNIGHIWVKKRFLVREFVDGKPTGNYVSNLPRIFIPAKLDDNPFLDREEYIKSLSNLDPITRKQYLKGDWTAVHGASKFQRQWFKLVDEWPRAAAKCRFWDMAATTPAEGKDPDYTCGIKVAYLEGQFWIVDVRRFRKTPKDTEDIIKQTTRLDGHDCDVLIEEEPGSEGKGLISHYQRNVIPGYTCRGVPATGSKEIRSNPVSSAAEAGNIFIVSGKWNEDYLDEMEVFPFGEHDDQVDGTSGAVAYLASPKAWVVAQEY